MRSEAEMSATTINGPEEGTWWTGGWDAGVDSSQRERCFCRRGCRLPRCGGFLVSLLVILDSVIITAIDIDLDPRWRCSNFKVASAKGQHGHNDVLDSAYRVLPHRKERLGKPSVEWGADHPGRPRATVVGCLRANGWHPGPCRRGRQILQVCGECYSRVEKWAGGPASALPGSTGPPALPYRGLTRSNIGIVKLGGCLSW